MKLIEVIAGCNTPAETVEKIKEISVAIGKSPVQVNEAAGFVVNRILIPMINEAAFIKMEGVSDIAGIDTAMKLGANHPMGPLELGDFIGLDICLAIMDVLYKETGDSKYRACPLIRKMVRGGNLGCKTGKGFYVYNADRTKTPVDAAVNSDKISPGAGKAAGRNLFAPGNCGLNEKDPLGGYSDGFYSVQAAADGAENVPRVC